MITKIPCYGVTFLWNDAGSLSSKATNASPIQPKLSYRIWLVSNLRLERDCFLCVTSLEFGLAITFSPVITPEMILLQDNLLVFRCRQLSPGHFNVK